MNNLAVIESEIIDVLPYEERTTANLAWVRENLANRDNTPSDVLAACQEFFGVTDARISLCESRLDSFGIQLNSHISETARNFDSVNHRINALETRAAVAEALATERQSNQQAINKTHSSGINSAHQSATHAAGNKGWGWTGDPTATFFLVLFMGVVGFGWISSLANTRPASVQSAPQDRPVMRGY